MTEGDENEGGVDGSDGGSCVSPAPTRPGPAFPQTSGSPHHQGQRRRAVQLGP